jgi:hypothetical protein
MYFKFLIIPTVLICQSALAQDGSMSMSVAPVSSTTAVPAPAPTTTNVKPDLSAPENSEAQVAIIDYKSVYEAATLEEEVKMATERFSLTKSQQDVWMTAAVDRRAAEKAARDKFDSKASSYEKDGMYRGLRTSHNTFYETITGYLSPSQKQAMEYDRMILEEKRKRVAKLPPPPPPAPTVTVAPVDSTAIKAAEKDKAKSKKKAKKKG